MIIRKNALVAIELTLNDIHSDNIKKRGKEVIYLHGGHGQLFPKLESELEGKKVGDRVHMTLSPADAFGEIETELIDRVPLSELPCDIEIGTELDGEIEDELDGVIYRVVEISDTDALLDGNHPYAGMSFVVDASVLEIEYISDDAIAEILEDHHH